MARIKPSRRATGSRRGKAVMVGSGASFADHVAVATSFTAKSSRGDIGAMGKPVEGEDPTQTNPYLSADVAGQPWVKGEN